MLLPLQGRNIAYDLVGPDNAPTVCITHSLASDGGSWAEQVPSLLQAGFRVLRIDMRGHGGSDPVPGDYTMRALADDVAGVLQTLAIPRVHYIGLSIGGMIGQAFALAHGDKLISAMWCDTLPASPSGAAAVWDERMNTVRRANSLAPIADGTVERWLTDAFKAKNPGRWRQIRDTGSPSGDSAQSTSDEQQHEDDEPTHSTESAAMAVAAGAESSPEQIAAASESDPAIATIVDSMLADLRPKIVEEVSRKLGKKK